MSIALSRRTFTLGSVAAAMGGSALLSSLQLTSAQDATASAGGDLSSLGLPTMDITINADSYDGAPSGDIAAGRYLLTATIADGLEYGAAAFMRPPAGMTAEDFLTQAGVGGGAPPEGSPPPGEEDGGEDMQLPLFVYQATMAGGAEGPGGTTAQSVIDLPPGEWILWGDDPSQGQSPVIFNVTGDMPADMPEPAADITFTLIDFAIQVEGNLAAGDLIVKVQNHGAQPHWVEVLKGPEILTDETLAEVLAMEMGMTDEGTPPALPFDPEKDLTSIWSTVTQSIATEQWMPLSIESGTYAAVCFFPTAGTGVPHAMNGMHTVFKVQ